jgi:hypothetical protein
MALRVAKAELDDGVAESMIKQLGAVPEPVAVMSHNPKVAEAGVQFGALVGEWDAADESLKSFAHMAGTPMHWGCGRTTSSGYWPVGSANWGCRSIAGAR